MRLWALALLLVTAACPSPAPQDIRCGDGRVDGLESCDDGNTSDGDGCSARCAREEACLVPPCDARCGDGVREEGEACDDGDAENGDGCSPTCFVVRGWIGGAGSPSTCLPRIGDGFVVGTEACDDGNRDSGDGCSSEARRELGWRCDASEPTRCESLCGDGYEVGGETCDDGNTESGDGCSATCRSSDRWERLAGRSAPSSRRSMASVALGSRVFVWGGENGSNLDDGAIFDTTTGAWFGVSRENAPSARSSPFVTWTGEEVILWSGSFIPDGAIYNPGTDRWRPMSLDGAPELSYGAGTAVWSGTEMLFVEFSWDEQPQSSAYDPTTNTWRRLSRVGAPASTQYPMGLAWTGREMIAWGAGSSEGALYRLERRARAARRQV